MNCTTEDPLHSVRGRIQNQAEIRYRQLAAFCARLNSLVSVPFI